MPRASLPGADALFGASPDPEPSGPPEQPAKVQADSQVLKMAHDLFVAESAAISAARQAAGDAAPPAAVGGILRWLIRRFTPSTVVEVGSAAGVTGLWMFEAMGEHDVLTSVEPDADAHAAASEAFKAAGAGRRIRAIHGDPRTILPRLSDASYGMVILHQPTHADLEDARRLLQPGGTLLTLSVTHPAFADEAERYLHQLAEDGQFDTAFLPVADGLTLSTFQL